MIFDFDPVAFSIFGFSVRWYTLAYLIPFVLCYYQMQRLCAKHSIDSKVGADYAFYPMLGIIIGGRLGYVLFYNFGYYAENPLEIFYLWQGGMSFHGGFLGACAGFSLTQHFIHPKSNYAPFYDLGVLVACLGIFFGRVANFFNNELWGKPTELPWGFYTLYQGEYGTYHPSQLYEAFFEGIVVLGLLFLVKRMRWYRPGTLVGFFMVFYAVFRFGIEFVRMPDAQLGYLAWGWLTMGQVLCVAILVVALVYFYRYYFHAKLS